MVIPQRVDLPGGRHLAVRVAGSGPDVVLLHGIPGSSAIWSEVMEALADTHRVIVPDLLGFGDSSRPSGIEDLWCDSQAAAVLEVAEALDVEAPILVGHDYGLPTALTLRLRAPGLVSGMVLAAGNAFPDTPIPFPLSTVTWRGVGAASERMLMSAPSLRMLLKTGVGRPRVRLDPAAYVGDGEQARAIRIIFAAALRELGTRYRPLAEVLPGIGEPTSVVWGSRDPFFPLDQGRRIADAIPDARWVELADAGHFLPSERPGAFVEEIRRIQAAR